jgi:hypothetical protein
LRNVKQVRPELHILNIAACHLCSSLAAKWLGVNLLRVYTRVLGLAKTTLLTNLLQLVIKVEVLMHQWSHSPFRPSRLVGSQPYTVQLSSNI